MIHNHSFLFNSLLANIITNNKGIIATRTIRQYGPLYPTLLPFINAFKSSPIDLLNMLIRTCTPHLFMPVRNLSHRIVSLLINYSLVIDQPINLACQRQRSRVRLLSVKPKMLIKPFLLDWLLIDLFFINQHQL